MSFNKAILSRTVAKSRRISSEQSRTISFFNFSTHKSLCLSFFPGLEAVKHRGERRLRAQDPRLWAGPAYWERDDRIRGHQVVQGARDHAQLDALSPDRYYVKWHLNVREMYHVTRESYFSRHVVCWLHHGRDANREDALPWNRPYVEQKAQRTHTRTLLFQNTHWQWSFFHDADIDQLTRIMKLVGTPNERLLEKLLSEEVFLTPVVLSFLPRLTETTFSFWLNRFSPSFVLCVCVRMTWLYRRADIDQLTRILVLCGTPSEDTLGKITSEEVNNLNREETWEKYIYPTHISLSL